MNFELFYHSSDLWRISYYNYVQMDYHVAKVPEVTSAPVTGTIGGAKKTDEDRVRKALTLRELNDTISRKIDGNDYKYVYRNGERICLQQ